jgi:hypothetical protein
MSLRVDLITPEEQRSGHAISLKSVIRVSSIVLPLLIVFALGRLILNTTLTMSELRVMESRWAVAEPKQKHALKLMGRLNFNRNTSEELEGWSQACIDWNKQLLTVIESAPPTIQVTSLIISKARDTEAPPSPPTRLFKLSIEGKVTGERAMRHVAAFKQNIEAHAASKERIDTVIVANYAADPTPDAGEFDRVFQLECSYHTLSEKAQE